MLAFCLHHLENDVSYVVRNCKFILVPGCYNLYYALVEGTFYQLTKYQQYHYLIAMPIACKFCIFRYWQIYTLMVEIKDFSVLSIHIISSTVTTKSEITWWKPSIFSNTMYGGRGSTLIWFGQECAIWILKPIPIFKGHLSRKRCPLWGIFVQYRPIFKNFRCLYGEHSKFWEILEKQTHV